MKDVKSRFVSILVITHEIFSRDCIMTSPRKLVVDCDPGTDDAIALLMAFYHDDVNIMGITAVSGNVPVDDCIRNILHVLRIINKPKVKYLTLNYTSVLQPAIVCTHWVTREPDSYNYLPLSPTHFV